MTKEAGEGRKDESGRRGEDGWRREEGGRLNSKANSARPPPASIMVSIIIPPKLSSLPRDSKHAHSYGSITSV